MVLLEVLIGRIAMIAVVCNKYGPPDVLAVKEVAHPILEDKQVLVKVHAASVNYGNLALLRGEPFLVRLAYGFLKPKYPIPGGDIAGRVEAVGKDVKQFQKGDEVYGDLSGCGWSGFAEYVAVPEHALALKPVNLSFEEAAAVPMAAATALQALRDKGEIQPGQKVLINGASGGVGTFAIQIAKSFGAEVTAVCSTRNVEMARSLGADHVIDYTCEDFTARSERYDLILAVNGYQPICAYKRLLSPTGKYIVVGGSGTQLFQALFFGPWISMTGSKKMGSVLQRPNQQDLIFMKELLEAEIVKPVIDRRYKMCEVTEAFKYFAEGHARGKVVLAV
jgi:NADPH:quinone reductase-like Zn-dependent oxidoreductase